MNAYNNAEQTINLIHCFENVCGEEMRSGGSRVDGREEMKRREEEKRENGNLRHSTATV
jgi:hypothetical protein